ncbi:unnamed protein product [Enterobius vermicularis]|uniref:Uncharacterized protein n=1 Tax=Enterobius vermicularis TaxID=51028 RepID=A0A0N4UZD9_ENTVE|nr:unnamed protein product [Enterobius vermicularis]
MSNPRQIEWIANLVDFSRIFTEDSSTSPHSNLVNFATKKCGRCNCKVSFSKLF